MSGGRRRNAASRMALLLIGIAFIVVSALPAFRIASRTVHNRHPDEVYHVDAFCYFQKHWRPPDLNSDLVVYSPDGWSRVYNGELVYLVYGQVSRLIGRTLDIEISEPATGVDTQCWDSSYRLFRYLNVALYMCTLAAVLVAGRREFWVLALGVSLAAIPQIVYVYSYANSDAWGLSLSVFLLLIALYAGRSERLSVVHAAALGLATGLVLLTKKPFWFAIPLPWMLFVQAHLPYLRETGAGERRRFALLMLLACSIAAVVSMPQRVIYPWTQGDFAAKELAMREMRSAEGFQPSDSSYGGMRLASRGEPFRTVWQDRRWWSWSAMSVYGVFGYMGIFLPAWMYAVAAASAMLGLGFTWDTLLQQWRRIPSGVVATLAVAVALIALNLSASLYNSWTFDYQPQGRYLFPSLLPLAYLWAGLYARELVWMRRTRWAILVGLWCLGTYVLWQVVIPAPVLLT